MIYMLQYVSRRVCSNIHHHMQHYKFKRFYPKILAKNNSILMQHTLIDYKQYTDTNILHWVIITFYPFIKITNISNYFTYKQWRQTLWPISCSWRSRYCNRAVTYSNRTIMVYLWNCKWLHNLNSLDYNLRGSKFKFYWGHTPCMNIFCTSRHHPT